MEATDLTPPRWSTSTMRRVANEATLADAALRYANLGIPVFPCISGGKRPLTVSGFHDATSSARIVQDWWRRWPDANVAIPTGAVSGVLVVDVDVHVGGSGFAAFERARAADLAEGWGWLVRTPSGGVHAYYPATPGREQRSWQVPATHIDFRGDGGYVIAPPSKVRVGDGLGEYAVLVVTRQSVRRIGAIMLRQFLEPPRQAPPPTSLPPVGTSLEHLAAFVAGLQEGERNHGLHWAACRAVEKNQPIQEALAKLGPAAQSIGLDRREIETTINSAYRHSRPQAQGQPASLNSPGSGRPPSRPGEVISL